jgi:glutaminyl-tRNA synthetase
LEFQDHRPLYDWFCQELGIYHPRQIEFARLNLSYTVMSKRKLLQLVQEKHVSGWDDPRMPTISGLRRRGYTPESIRLFCERIGVARFYSTIDIGVMAVMNPLLLTITNYPAGQVEWMEAVNNPEDAASGARQVPFARQLYIEHDDFMENAPKKYFRLTVGAEVRLRYGYIIRCDEVIKNAAGEIVELKCSYDPDTKSGSETGTTRKVKGTIHWVSAEHCVDAEVRLYDRLCLNENPEDVAQGKTFLDNLNPDNLKVVTAKVEPALAKAQPGDRFQFERTGYFCVDNDSAANKLVFNRTVALRDSWAKEMNK